MEGRPRSGQCKDLCSYQYHIGAASSDLFFECGSSHTSGHLFACPSHPTPLAVTDHYFGRNPQFASLPDPGPYPALTLLYPKSSSLPGYILKQSSSTDGNSLMQIPRCFRFFFIVDVITSKFHQYWSRNSRAMVKTSSGYECKLQNQTTSHCRNMG